jgi:hypothetical protein
MRPVTQLAPSAPAQPPPGRGAPTEASAGPFAAILDNHQARTAVAEGHTPKRPTGAEDQATTPPATPDARDAAADATTPATTPDVRSDDGKDGASPAPALPVLVDPAPVALAAAAPVVVLPAAAPAPTASPAPAPAPAPPAAPPAGLPGPDAAPAVPVPGTPVAGAPLPGAAAPGTPLPGTPAQAPTAGAPQPATPAPADAPAGISLPVAPQAGDDPAAPTTDPASSADAAAAAQSGTEQRRGGDAGSGDTPGDAPRAMTSPVADALRAAAPAAAHATTPADTSAAAAATASTPAPATTATATVAAPAAPTSSAGVPLEQAVETVRLTVSAAARNGVTRARIALRPEELGGVEVHLRHTAEGLSARVVAEVPEAAHLLAQAAGELRRTLEQQGVNVVRIDVGIAGDEAAGAGAGDREQRDARRNGGGSAAGDAPETDLPIPDRTIELPNGALVDVLA